MPDRADESAPAPRRVLVTGGAGFIGSHLVDAFLARGDSVTVVDDLSTGSRENLSTHEGDSRLTLIQSTVSEAVSGPLADAEPFDEIHHMAAAVGVMRILERPTESIETNIHETSAILHYAVEHQRDRLPHVLIASSSEVYGLGGAGEKLAEDDPVTYGPTTAHRWSYGYAKAIDEFLALARAREDGLPVVIARFFNIVGPRQSGRHGMVLPRFVEAAVRGEELHVFGNGTQVRTFCDVRDVIGPLLSLVGQATASGRVVNIGSDRPISVSELAQLVVETLSSGSGIRTIPYDEAYSKGFQDLPHRRPDLTRLRGLVGFDPSIPLTETIRDIADGITSDSASARPSRTSAPR